MWPLNYKLAVEPNPGYLRIAVKGTYGLGRTRRLFRAIGRLSDHHQLRRVLIDFTGVTRQPSDMDRFELGERLAEVFGFSTYALAFIVRKEIVNRLTETVAINRGVAIRVFFTEQDALTWLLTKANTASRGDALKTEQPKVAD